MTNIFAVIILSAILSGTGALSQPVPEVAKIETTDTGALVTFEDGTGYYYEF